jgi:hypothetical protein
MCCDYVSWISTHLRRSGGSQSFSSCSTPARLGRKGLINSHSTTLVRPTSFNVVSARISQHKPCSGTMRITRRCTANQPRLPQLLPLICLHLSCKPVATDVIHPLFIMADTSGSTEALNNSFILAPGQRMQHRRAARACTTCRMRKVRCDFLVRYPRSCTNCELDAIECSVPTYQ